jgi:acetyl esterase/lipase
LANEELTMVRHLCIGMILLAGVVCAQPPADKTTKPKPERPSQDAVLAKNTVVLSGQAFGKDEKQSLDVYAPKDVKSAPIVIFVHGGEWTKGDKSAVSFKPKFFNENNIVFVSTNYRLSPAAKHPAHVSDIAAAVAWVRAHAEKFGGDPGKIVLMGHSAGCHLATLTALDPRHLKSVNLSPTDLRGVVAWSGGMYDLVERAKGEGTYPKYIRQAFGESERDWLDASPVAHVGDAAMPPFLFASTEKGSASHTAAERMLRLIQEKKGQARSLLLTGRDHFMANHLIGAPDDTTGPLLLEFIRNVTK